NKEAAKASEGLKTVSLMKMPLTASSATDCKAEPLLFHDLGSRQVVADFSGGTLSSHGGEWSNRRFAPRGAGAWAALARSGLLPACKKWRSRRASCWLTLTSFTTPRALPRRMRRRRSARRWTSPQPQGVRRQIGAAYPARRTSGIGNRDQL